MTAKERIEKAYRLFCMLHPEYASDLLLRADGNVQIAPMFMRQIYISNALLTSEEVTPEEFRARPDVMLYYEIKGLFNALEEVIRLSAHIKEDVDEEGIHSDVEVPGRG